MSRNWSDPDDDGVGMTAAERVLIGLFAVLWIGALWSGEAWLAGVVTR